MFYTNTCSPVKFEVTIPSLVTIPSAGVDSEPHGEKADDDPDLTEEELERQRELEDEDYLWEDPPDVQENRE
jgi:hypothetical protein